MNIVGRLLVWFGIVAVCAGAILLLNGTLGLFGIALKADVGLLFGAQRWLQFPVGAAGFMGGLLLAKLGQGILGPVETVNATQRFESGVQVVQLVKAFLIGGGIPVVLSGVAYEMLGEHSPRAALGFAAGASISGAWFLWETRSIVPKQLHRALVLALVCMNLLTATGAVQLLWQARTAAPQPPSAP